MDPKENFYITKLKKKKLLKGAMETLMDKFGIQYREDRFKFIINENSGIGSYHYKETHLKARLVWNEEIGAYNVSVEFQ